MRGRADELDVAAFADFYEMRVLRQKSVAWMNRVNVAYFGRAHDPIDPQITVKAGSGTDANRFIGKVDVQRIDVRFRIDCERTNAQFITGANDSQGDLSP